MQIEDVTKLPEVNGTKKQKERAQTAFNIFRLRGAFYPDSSPIRIALPELSQYIREFEGGSKDITNALIAALEANPDIFWKEEIGDEIFFGTTRVGTSTFGDVSPEVDSHSLQARFATPEPPRPRPISRHDEIPELDSLLDASIGESANLYPADSWQAAVAAALADADSAETGTISLSGEQVDSVELELDPTTEVDEHEELVVEMETDTAVSAEELILEETVTEEVVVAEEIVAEADILNITEASVDEVAESIVNLLENEPEIVRWGQHWMAEPAIPRLSRGDLRKTQEFIVSSDKPLTDAELVSDLRGIHRNDDVFETERFGLNYRLSRETNDFEFVGTANQGLWTVPGQLEPVTAPARKINEIGQDYRYLSDYPSPDEDLEVGIIEHVLSYYEYVNGVLPLDANTATLMPESAYSEQRATRITFENPLTHETFSAELRYPTGNRGGFIYGLAEFFEENMVPGAVITLESTDVETHFIIEYFQVSGQDRKLLNLDHKKDQYVFVSTTFYCAVQDEMLLDEGHFGKLNGVSSIEERVRRSPELVIARAFELIGDEVQVDGKTSFSAALFDLLAVGNVDRPISLEFLRDMLTGEEFPEFGRDERDEGRFIYTPAE